MTARPVTLSSDFGTADWYVAAMKGQLLRLAPQCVPIDLMHDLPAYDAEAAAFALAQATRAFPPDCIHLCVVDPGVGGARRAIALRDRSGSHFVGPDNGVLTRAADGIDAVVELPLPEDASRTFHGRDVFAPAAARLAAGEELESLGRRIDDISRCEARWRRDGETWIAPVLWIDRFGNLISDLPASEIPSSCGVEIGELRLDRLQTHFAEVERKEFLAYVGSSGTLEVAVREGDAAARLGARRGTPMFVRAT